MEGVTATVFGGVSQALQLPSRSHALEGPVDLIAA